MAVPKYGIAYTFTAILIDSGTGLPRASPTLVAGDVEVSTDDGAFASIASLPSVLPAASIKVKTPLSAAEMTGQRVDVRFKDQTVPTEWDEVTYSIEVDDIYDLVSTRAPKGAIGSPGTQGTHTPAIHTLKYRDTGPALDLILHDPAAAGSPPGTVGPVHTLPVGATYTLIIKLNNGTVLTRAMTRIAPDTDGHVRYQPVAADWNAGGLIIGPVPPLKPNDVEHLLEVEEVLGSTRLTYPNGGYDILRIIPDLGNG